MLMRNVLRLINILIEFFDILFDNYNLYMSNSNLNQILAQYIYLNLEKFDYSDWEEKEIVDCLYIILICFFLLKWIMYIFRWIGFYFYQILNLNSE